MKPGPRMMAMLFLIGICPTARSQWTQTNEPYGGDVFCLAASPNETGGTNLFAGTFFGGSVFLSTNDGASWTLVSKGENRNVYRLAVSGRNLLVGSNRGLSLLTDNGASWTEVDTGLTNHDVGAFAVDGNTVFAGTGIRLFPDGSVFRSTNNGTSWSLVSTDLAGTWISALAISGTNLFAGTHVGYAWPGRGVFRSTDNGTNWTSVNAGLTDTNVTALVVSGTDLFAGTHWDGVFRSTDNGASWTAVNGGLTNSHILALTVSPNGAGGTVLFAGTDGPYVGTSSSGVFLSTNNGESWAAVNDGLTDTSVGALAMNSIGPGGTNLFALTGVGIFRRPLSEMVTSVQLPSNEAPQTFDLSQNYPNPFNPSTTIRYGLPERLLVTLAVFNTLGQQVATLVQGEEDAGYHEIQFDASGLASGMYLYRLQAGGFVQSKRLVLVR